MHVSTRLLTPAPVLAPSQFLGIRFRWYGDDPLYRIVQVPAGLPSERRLESRTWMFLPVLVVSVSADVTRSPHLFLPMPAWLRASTGVATRLLTTLRKGREGQVVRTGVGITTEYHVTLIRARACIPLNAAQRETAARVCSRLSTAAIDQYSTVQAAPIAVPTDKRKAG